MENKKKVIVIAGPTASGKTGCAVELAVRLGGEIVSADSMQIYKYMDIGSAKPTEEEQRRAVHYLVDEIEPDEPFSVAEYRKRAGAYIDLITDNGKVPLLVGGTGLYIHSVVSEMDYSGSIPDTARRQELRKIAEEQGAEGLHRILETLDAEAAGRIHPHNLKRTIRAIEAAEQGRKLRPFEHTRSIQGEYDCLLFCLNRDRRQLYERIDRRVDEMISEGLVDEVRMLTGRGLRAEDISMKGIGYKEIIAFLEGEYDLEEAIRLVKRNTRRYAKRQLTWFRRYPDMIWLDVTDSTEAAVSEMTERARRFLQEG